MLEKKPSLDCCHSSVKPGPPSSEVGQSAAASSDSCAKSVPSFVHESNAINSHSNSTNHEGDIKQSIKTSPGPINSTSSTNDLQSFVNVNTYSCCHASPNSSLPGASSTMNAGNVYSCKQEPASCMSVSAASCSISSQEISCAVQQAPMNETTSDSNSVTSNKENAPPASGKIQNDVPPMSAISTLVASAANPPVSASIQPLPSNVVSKSCYQMEAQYMQQQSQIFVFSTYMANKAAESCLTENCPSIIAYHCAQPGTKSFLEKYPLKVQQFSRPNPSVWFNSLAQAKQQPGSQQLKPSFPSLPASNNRFFGPSSGSPGDSCNNSCRVQNLPMCGNSNPAWTNNPGILSPGPNSIAPQTWSPHMSAPSSSMQRFSNPAPRFSIRPNGNHSVYGSNSNSNCDPFFPNSPLNSVPMNQGSSCSALTGVKIPDENLTPQQRQHREEQLATIRKMQQVLFPEQQPLDQELMIPSILPGVGMPNQLDSNAQYPPMPMPNQCVRAEERFSPHQQVMNGKMSRETINPNVNLFSGSQMVNTNAVHSYRPGSSSTVEWKNVPNQFYEKNGSGALSQPSSFSGVAALQHPNSRPPTPQHSPRPGSGYCSDGQMHGPPPPYHQANKKAMLSPSSPNPRTLLPSSCAVSPSADSGPKHFPVHATPGSRLSHSSPSPTTMAGNSSLHATPPPSNLKNLMELTFSLPLHH